MCEMDGDALLAQDFGLVTGGNFASQKSLRRREPEQKLIAQFRMKD
jgi:hypothetical protein